MNKTVRTEEVLRVYNVLSAAKYQKMDDDDKVKVWKIVRKLKPVSTKFEEDRKDAIEKFKPEGFDDKVQKMADLEQQELSKIEGERTEQSIRNVINALMASNEEYSVYRKKELSDYNNLVAKAIQEFADKEVEIEFDTLSEEAFGKLMSSNDWNMEQVSLVGDFVCE